MRHGTSGAILDTTLYVYEITAALIAEGVKWATTKHAVEVLPLYLMTGVVLARLVLEVFTAVVHKAPRLLL